MTAKIISCIKPPWDRLHDAPIAHLHEQPIFAHPGKVPTGIADGREFGRMHFGPFTVKMTARP
jgi:hypothetical protein